MPQRDDRRQLDGLVVADDACPGGVTSSSKRGREATKGSIQGRR